MYRAGKFRQPLTKNKQVFRRRKILIIARQNVRVRQRIDRVIRSAVRDAATFATKPAEKLAFFVRNLRFYQIIAPLNQYLKIIKLLIDEKEKKHLESLGLGVNQRIMVLTNNNGNIILMVNDNRLAIDKNIATKIIVSLD